MKNILVTGGTGLIGKALKEIMPDAIYVGSSNYDLRIENDVERLMYTENPDIIIHLAALVSGIADNIKRPADHFTDNILMNTHIINEARRNGTIRFIGILSTCAYADSNKSYPIDEIDIYDGVPTPTNFSYGMAKRMMAVQIEATNKQYGTSYQYMIPCNIYGENDNFSNDRSHFVAALISKIYKAKVEGKDSITLMGNGTSLRQFIYVNDVAKIIKYFIDNDITENVNICNDEVYSIDAIAKIALQACNAEYLKIVYDTTKPNGQFRKDASNEKLKSLIPQIQFTPLFEGIKKTYTHYAKKCSI